MNKEDKLILKAFLSTRVPKDFDDTISKMCMVDSIIGLAQRAYQGEIFDRALIQSYDLNKEIKEEIRVILSNSQENLKYYYLLKLVILVLYNQSNCS